MLIRHSVQRLPHRYGDHIEVLQAAVSRVRDSDHVRRPRIRRGKEDYLARRARRARRAAEVPVHRVTHPLTRLFRYARPYRFRLGWAVVGMVVYAIGTAGLAWLVKPIFDSVLPNQERLTFTASGIVL